jgi:hypothetical protein
MSGYELSTTIITYKKKPGTDVLYKDAVIITVFVQTLTIDILMVPIAWVDAKGNMIGISQGDDISGVLNILSSKK